MLTDRRIALAKPEAGPYKISDERGLFLLVTPSGSKLWRQKYRFCGKEKLLAHGSYPDVSLKLARERRDQARRLLAEGSDPAEAKKVAKQAVARKSVDSFEVVAQEWFSNYQLKQLQSRRPLAPATVKKLAWLLNLPEYREEGERRAPHVLQRFMGKAVSSITVSDIRELMGGMVGRLETAHRTLKVMRRVLAHAVATGRLEVNVATAFAESSDPRDALPRLRVRHHAAITDPAAFGALLRAIDGYEGQPSTCVALRLSPYLFVRPGELRAARWAEFDLSAAGPIWRIPAERMKMRRPHVVPLAPQVVALLVQHKAVTGGGELIFPSLTNRKRPLSENAVTAALRRMGYPGSDMTWHGFRSSASTLLNELGWDPELIELQLAHSDKDKVRAAYNRAERLPERREMMAAWADYLDSLRASVPSR